MTDNCASNNRHKAIQGSNSAENLTDFSFRDLNKKPTDAGISSPYPCMNDKPSIKEKLFET